MNIKDVRKILILDQGDPVADQLLAKAVDVFGQENVEYVMLRAHKTHGLALNAMEKAIREEQPHLVLIGATALGEEIAPALGVRLAAGVAAHCVDIRANEEGRLTFMIPAFGGRFIGEIFIPDAKAGRPAIATVKPGIFQQRISLQDAGWRTDMGTAPDVRIIDLDAMSAEGSLPAELAKADRMQGAFRLMEISPREHAAGSIADADIIVCGGYGLGREEVWHKLEVLADRLGGAAACTRAALDAEWGCTEDMMIGTSGRAVSPEIYIGLGISGAAHHTCGITGAGKIININADKDADAFAVSDYKGVFDAEQVIDALLDITE